MTLTTIQKIDRVGTDSDLFHETVHGGPTETVNTEGGAIPTMANAINTLRAFNVRGEWVAGMTLNIKDVVTHGGIAYVSLQAAAYVSDDFDADLAAGRLTVHQGATREDLAAPDGSGGIGFLQAGDGAVARTLESKAREWISAADYSLTTDIAVQAADKRAIVGYGETVTLNIPSAFPSVKTAMAAIADWVVHGTVTLKLADGVYEPDEQIRLNHPYGRNLQIIGNPDNPTACEIRIDGAPTFDLFTSSFGNVFGLVDGVYANLSTKAGSSTNFAAFLALQGGKIYLGQHVHVNNWYYSVAARNGAFIRADNVVASNAGDVAIWAFCGSAISAQNANVSGSSDPTNGWGVGIMGEYCSQVECSGANATGCLVAGIAAYSNSQVRALGGSSNGNTGSGLFARDNGSIECHGIATKNNGRYGVEEFTTGRIFYNTIDASGNALGLKAPVAALDNSNLGARLVASGGPLRLDTVDASSVYFNTGGGLQFEVADAANAVNHLGVSGSASGQAVRLFAAGPDAKIDIAVLPKGAGSYVQLGAGFGGVVNANGSLGVKDNAGDIVYLLAYKP